MELIPTPVHDELLNLEDYPVALMIECLASLPNVVAEEVDTLKMTMSILRETSPAWRVQSTCATVLTDCMSLFISTSTPTVEEFLQLLDNMVMGMDADAQLALCNEIAQVRYERMAANGEA